MPRDWEHIIATFSDRRGLSDETRQALRAFVDAHVTGATVTIEPDGWAASRDGLPSTVLDVIDDGDAPTEPRHMPDQAERYLDLGTIGAGGMGEVRRVRDLALNRTMAMKIMREGLLGRPAAEARFLAEAQATAQLQHPGIVPVHDVGRLPDGRWYFTMKELRGETLHDVLWTAEKDPARWPRRRLLEVLRSVAETVAYSHDRGVVHRDLKPANILVGAFGEVTVLDWGLVKTVANEDIEDIEDPEAPAMALDSFATRAGAVLGTPAYMPPEQAEGARDVGPRSDVYALGALLYEILAGHPPYEGEAKDILTAVKGGPPPTLDDDVPEELRATVDAAMVRSVSERTLTAAQLVAHLTRYLDGAARRDRALDIIREADALQPQVESRLEASESSRSDALALARETPDWAGIEAKRPIWAKEDEAATARQEADLIGLHRLQLLRAALTEVPDLPEAQERLAYVYHFCHFRAETQGNGQEAAQYELLLKEQDTGRYADYLSGDGLLTLYSEPRARASLYRYEVVDRRYQARWERDLGDTPLLQTTLPMGSWVVRLESTTHDPVNYPVSIRRQERWDGVPPGARHPQPVPHPGPLGPDEIYVPGGWALLGGDHSVGVPPQRCWVDGFVVQRFQVTNLDYIAFLDDLVVHGRGAEAAAHLPRTGAGTPTYWQDELGRHHLGLDDEGDGWLPEHPVVCITLDDARAYAAWRTERTGHPWRLPWSDEWEKAARGVDGRRYPMGDHLDPTWANVRGCHPDMVVLAGVTAFPTDVSPYGARGMAGGVMDLCHDRWTHPRLTIDGGRAERVAANDDSYLVGRGGWRTADVEQCAAERQSRLSPHVRVDALGFRLVRSVDGPRARRGLDYRFTT